MADRDKKFKALAGRAFGWAAAILFPPTCPGCRKLIAEPGTPNVALSYVPENAAARALYLSLGFVETGEKEGDEVIARWTPPAG